MNDCNKTRAYITDAVDDRLSESERELFDHHIQQCVTCRNEYELDSLTKSFIKNRLARHSTPAQVVERIREEIKKQAALEQRKRGFLPQYRLARAAALLVVVIGAALILYFINSPNVQNTVQAADILDQSIENYSLFLAGAIQPQTVGQSVDELREYFADRVDFPVALKPVNECEWVGGVLSEYKGLPLAHLVYKMPAGIIYVYQASWSAVQQGNKISLSNGAIAKLNETGWYINGGKDDFNIVMWLYNDETLCTAVSSIDKETLQKIFKTELNRY